MPDENKNLKISKIREVLGIVLTIIGEGLIIFCIFGFVPAVRGAGSDFYGVMAILIGAIAFVGLILSFLGISIGKFRGKRLLIARIIPVLFLLSVILLLVISLIQYIDKYYI